MERQLILSHSVELRLKEGDNFVGIMIESQNLFVEVQSLNAWRIVSRDDSQSWQELSEVMFLECKRSLV